MGSRNNVVKTKEDLSYVEWTIPLEETGLNLEVSWAWEKRRGCDNQVCDDVLTTTP